MNARPLLLSLTLLLSGCDLIDQLMTDPKQVQRDADAKAIGAGCRHALRSIEDCYVLNPKASKSLVFTGWKDMDQYMRDNKIEGVAPLVGKPQSAADTGSEETVTESPAKDKGDMTKSKSKLKDKSKISKPDEKPAG